MSNLPFNIDGLIHFRSIEQSRLEFKATWDEFIKAAVTRTICAFANDFLNLNGGYIVIGIETDDTGQAILPPRGLAGLDVDRIQREIRGQCERLETKYFPLFFPEIYQERQILVIWMPGGDNRPYQAPKQKDIAERAYFVRVGSETVEAKGDILRQLLSMTAKVPFDDRRNQDSRMEHLSSTLVRQFLQDVKSDLVLAGTELPDAELYDRLRIVISINQHKVPRNVGLLFFSERPERFFPGTRIDIVQFADDAGGNLIEERIIRGPLHFQIRQALDYLNSLTDVLLKKVPGRPDVQRTVAYPYEAMEEAVVNAVYHRSYESSTEPTKVYLFPDRMEIISYPGPVSGLDQIHLEAGQTVPPFPARNRRIGEMLKELRLAEMRGTGLPKIRRRMEENGSPEPKFDFDTDRNYFRVTLPVHPRYQVLHALRESAHLWAIGERADALAHLQRAHEQQPSSGAIASQIIEYSFASDNFDLARKIFERFQNKKDALKTDEALPYLRFASGLLDLDQDNTQEALRVLLMVPPATSVEDIIEAAILRKRARDYKEAHRLFSEIYDEMKDDPRVVQEFAQAKISLARDLYRKEHRPTKKRLNEEAVELLRRAIQLTSDSVREAWCWLDLAQALAWLREPATEVESAFLKARALNPTDPRFQRVFEKGFERWKNRQQNAKRRNNRTK